MAPDRIPLPTLRRLPLYRDLFRAKQASEEDWVSSETIGTILGFGAIQVRKDLGAPGTGGCLRPGLARQGFRISGVFDLTPERLGRALAGELEASR